MKIIFVYIFHVIFFFCSKVPDLKSAWLESPAANKTAVMKTLLLVLSEVASELQESTDSKKDLPDRLASVRHILPLLSLEDLFSLQDQVKSQENPLVWY